MMANLGTWLRNHFELSRGGDAHNMRPMEGMRGFAVFLVFLVHYVTLLGLWLEPQSNIAAVADALHTIGNVGVDLFFVLSGYLIYGSLIRRPQHFGRYMRRRFTRIYPTFTVVFLLYLVLSFAFPQESKIPPSAVDGAIYLAQNFFLLCGFSAIPPMITVAWTLTYEMFYYLVIPAIIGLFVLRTRSRKWRLLFFSLVLVLMLTGFSLFGGPIRLVMFIAGIFLQEAIASESVPIPGSGIAAVALAGTLLSMLLPNLMTVPAALAIMLLATGFFVFCLACFAAPHGWLARLFAWTPLRWFGNMSYSYYLMHGLALKASVLVLSKLLPVSSIGSEGGLFFLAMLLPLFLLTLIPSAILFLTVERPWSLAPHS